MTATIRYIQGAMSQTVPFSGTSDGKDYQLLAVTITLTDVWPKNTKKDLFVYKGSGKIKSILNAFGTNKEGVIKFTGDNFLLNIVNDTINLSTPNTDNIGEMNVGTKISLLLVVGNY